MQYFNSQYAEIKYTIQCYDTAGSATGINAHSHMLYLSSGTVLSADSSVQM